MSDLEKYLLAAVENIRKDREVTKRLLDDAMVYLSANEERHKEVGITVAKYDETLQRSNEQLVKITTPLQRKESKQAGLTSFDKDEIYEMLQGSDEDETDG